MACDRFEQPVSCAFNSRLQKHTPVRKFWRKLAQVSPLQQTLGESAEAGRPYQAASVNCGSAVKVRSDFYVAIRSTTARTFCFRNPVET
jgi:hypothetical protein